MRSATVTSVRNRAVAPSDVADFPAKNIAGSNGVPIASQFLSDAFPSNLVRAGVEDLADACRSPSPTSFHQIRSSWPRTSSRCSVRALLR